MTIFPIIVLENLTTAKSPEILIYLCIEGEARFSEFEEELGLNPSTVNRTLNKLQEIDAVEKKKGIYRVTPQGREAASVYMEFDSEACSYRCDPDICVGPLWSAVTSLDDFVDSPTHDVLAALPAEPNALREGMDAEVRPLDRVSMLERWGLVREEYDLIARTHRGETALHLLDDLSELHAERLG